MISDNHMATLYRPEIGWLLHFELADGAILELCSEVVTRRMYCWQSS